MQVPCSYIMLCINLIFCIYILVFFFCCCCFAFFLLIYSSFYYHFYNKIFYFFIYSVLIIRSLIYNICIMAKPDSNKEIHTKLSGEFALGK